MRVSEPAESTALIHPTPMSGFGTLEKLRSESLTAEATKSASRTGDPRNISILKT